MQHLWELWEKNRDIYYRGKSTGIKTRGRSVNSIQEKLHAQQKETEEERQKRESVEDKLIKVHKKLEEE